MSADFVKIQCEKDLANRIYTEVFRKNLQNLLKFMYSYLNAIELPHRPLSTSIVDTFKADGENLSFNTSQVLGKFFVEQYISARDQSELPTYEDRISHALFNTNFEYPLVNCKPFAATILELIREYIESIEQKGRSYKNTIIERERAVSLATIKDRKCILVNEQTSITLTEIPKDSESILQNIIFSLKNKEIENLENYFVIAFQLDNRSTWSLFYIDSGNVDLIKYLEYITTLYDSSIDGVKHIIYRKKTLANINQVQAGYITKTDFDKIKRNSPQIIAIPEADGSVVTITDLPAAINIIQTETRTLLQTNPILHALVMAVLNPTEHFNYPRQLDLIDNYHSLTSLLSMISPLDQVIAAYERGSIERAVIADPFRIFRQDLETGLKIIRTITMQPVEGTLLQIQFPSSPLTLNLQDFIPIPRIIDFGELIRQMATTETVRLSPFLTAVEIQSRADIKEFFPIPIAKKLIEQFVRTALLFKGNTKLSFDRGYGNPTTFDINLIELLANFQKVKKHRLFQHQKIGSLNLPDMWLFNTIMSSTFTDNFRNIRSTDLLRINGRLVKSTSGVSSIAELVSLLLDEIQGGLEKTMYATLNLLRDYSFAFNEYLDSFDSTPSIRLTADQKEFLKFISASLQLSWFFVHLRLKGYIEKEFHKVLT